SHHPGSPSSEQKAQRQRAIEELKPILSMLCERYPQAFSLKNPKPLKVGIVKDLQKPLKDEYSKSKLQKALGYYIYNSRYQKALAIQDHRYNLQGQIEGEVAEEHKARAHAQLMKIKKGYKSRKE
ncbi:MAG: ProQ/FinO family protein, partial [Alphaproteobacteria bacterium]|nr:ProQ/FinO family protein [Alphaproteobacteria bacterium]